MDVSDALVSGQSLSVGEDRTSTFQFLVVEGEALVYKVFFPDRVQHRYMVLRNAFLSGMWSRSLFLGLVKAFKIFFQDRVHPLLLAIQLVVLKRWMSLGTGFFALFPKFKKSATQPPHSRSALPPHSSPWTPSAYDVPMVLEEEEEESELEEAAEFDEVALMVEYVACDGRWWGQQWVPTAQQFCWWLAAADGSQLGHTIWRPPWDFP